MKKNNILKILANMFSKSPGSDARINEDLSYYHNERDLKDSNSTKPPSGEKVRVPSIWAFEIYTPSTISNLYIGIKNLGLSNSLLGIDSHHEDSIKKLRFRSSGSGWINLGMISNKSIKKLMSTKSANLPQGITGVRFSVLQNIPSITILICQFFFDEETANSLNEPLSRNYSTYTEKIKLGVRIINVPHQKKKQTDLMRSYLRSLCTSWIAENMPGYFSSKHLQTLFPTCELIVLSKHNPIDKIGDELGNSFLSMLDLGKEYNVWYANNINGLYLYLTENRREQTNNIVLSGNINEMLSNKDLSIFRSESKEENILGWFSYFDYTLGILVLSFIAREYEQQLGMFRDKYGSVNIKDISYSIRQMQDIDKQFIEMQSGIIHFSDELKNFCKHKGYFMHEVYEFGSVRKHFDHELNLFESIRDRLIYLSDLIDLNMKHVMSYADIMRQSISAISSRELATINLKLQKGIYWMTGVLIILTIVLAAPAIKSIITSIIEFVQKFIKF
jgi:hypothetical protein